MSLLSSDRTRWQEDTITQIRRNLRILPMNASGERLSAQETTRVVVMYGYPQVGKTTVLLQLCGIRDELSEELETLLRAGEPIGSSSTSTAILYERADREDFGLGSLKGETDWFESGQDFSDALRQVREEVEAQQRETGVLRICIPKRFYRPDASAAPIRILDLPGVDSRNKNEEQHVRALMESFLLTADLRIVVCKAANLQSLEDPLPFLPDNWLQLPSEYLVIATHAFSENTIRRKLESMQEGHFSAYIRETYTGFLNEKLNRKCRVPIFPLEGGTSWRMLLDQLSDEAKSRAEEALRDSLSGIREAILRRQGNRLAAIIDRLRDRTETMNMTLESEIREALLALREREKAAEKSIEECQRSLASLAKEEEKAAKTAARRNEGAPKLPQPMPPSFDRLELIRTWFGRIRNKDHSLRDQITNLFTEAGDAYFQEATVSTVFHALNIRNTQHFVNQALDDNDAFEELIHRIEPGQKVKPRELEDRFEDAAAEFCARLWRSADQAVRTAWKKQNSPSQNEWYLAQLRSTYPKTLKKHQQRLREIQDSILQREQQEAKLKEDLLADLNTLSTYLAAAKQCYDRYFRQCIRRMPGLARQEQMQMLVHLGLIERDYNHIMMGGSLNGSKET